MKITKLDDVINYIESYSDDSGYYIDTESGKIISIQNYYWNLADDMNESGNDPDLSGYRGWEAEEINTALSILSDTDGRFIWLPGKTEILDEYDIIQAFCKQEDDAESRLILLELIKGHGAFRRFRSAIERLGLLDEWYAFKDNAYRDAAVKLCERLEISYE